MIVLFLLALPATYRDVDMRNFFTSFNQTVIAFNIIIIFTGVNIMMTIITVKASMSPVFCFTSVGKIWVRVAFRWQRLLSVATL